MSKKETPTPDKGVLIFGASGHAKVVIDIVEKTGMFSVRGLFDDNAAVHGQQVYGYGVMGGRNEMLLQAHGLVVAIGSNTIRSEVAAWLIARGACLSEALVHPSAQLARGTEVGAGSVVMAGAVINSDSRVGRNAIINTGAIVDHDCSIGDGVHVAPGATICGGVEVGEHTLIGAGAVVHPNVRIGKKVTVGAGATVLDNIEDGMTVVGSPAKPIR